ncbi:MAG TPA: LysE/ArgO family amino acid transporter [Cellulomonas sp.]
MTPPLAALATLSGLASGLSLIVAIGAQNAYVLRVGLRRAQVLPVVVVCTTSDAVLITAGVAGLGTIIDRVPAVLAVARVGGAAFLLGYAAVAARRAWRPGAPLTAPDSDGPVGGGSAGPPATPAWPAVATALALTWLNPHVHLDTVLLLGSLAGTHGEQRWWFAAGAVLASALWFTALGYGARLLRPVFARPGAWRVLDAGIAVVMAVIAVNLLRGW